MGEDKSCWKKIKGRVYSDDSQPFHTQHLNKKMPRKLRPSAQVRVDIILYTSTTLSIAIRVLVQKPCTRVVAGGLALKAWAQESWQADQLSPHLGPGLRLQHLLHL